MQTKKFTGVYFFQVFSSTFAYINFASEKKFQIRQCDLFSLDCYVIICLESSISGM